MTAAVQGHLRLWQVLKIRPEQRGHSRFLRRGRDTKLMQYGLLVVSASAAVIGLVAVFAILP